MSLPVAILAGGLATRLGALSEQAPKVLVDVGGRPFAEWQIDLLRRQGLYDIVLLVGHLGEQVRDALGDGSRLGVSLRYVFDGPRALGTGGAIQHALPLLGDAFFVLYGDSYLECDYASIEKAFRRRHALGLMTLCQNDGRWDTSNVLFDRGRVLVYDKRMPTPQMRHIDYGLGVFDASAFATHAEDELFDLADVYQELLAGGELAGHEVAGRFYEIGSPAGLEETRAYLAPKGLVTR